MSEKHFPLDIQVVKKYRIADWQRDFFWPVSDVEFRGMCDRIEEILARHIEEDPKEVSNVFLIKRNLLTEYTHFLHAVWVLDRIGQQGLSPLYDNSTLWYSDMITGSFKGRTDSLSGKRSTTFPLGRPPTWRSRLHTEAATWRANGLKKFLKQKSSGQQKVYGIPTPPASDYIRHSKDGYVVTLPAEWIPPNLSHAEKLGVLDYTDKEVAARLVDEIATAAQNYQIPLTDDHQEYLLAFTKEQVREGVLILSALRSSLQNSVPAQVLMPILGAPAQRAVALVVRQLGGKVTSFSHGGNVGLFNVPTFSLSEFALADEFVTYTKGSVPLFERIQNNFPPPRRNRVTIKSAPSPYYLKLWRSFSRIPTPLAVRKVMIVAFPHTPWRKSHGTAMFSLMHLDLELRLAKLLKEAGYEVIYKAHPDRLKEIDGIFDSLATVITDDFKYVHNQADAYFFGSLRTTALPLALCTNKLIAALQMKDEFPQPFEDAFTILKKRCTIIPGWFDKRNRIMFDEKALKESLTKIPKVPNTEFVEKYLCP